MSPCRRDQSEECTRPRHDFSSAAAVHRTRTKALDEIRSLSRCEFNHAQPRFSWWKMKSC
jgi:hypothetical protein